jgi:SOS-response transcriptional repressor LexA
VNLSSFIFLDEKMNLKDLLTKYNGGIFRGAQTRLANSLAVGESTISRIVAGDLEPGEELRSKMCKVLGVSQTTLISALAATKAERNAAVHGLTGSFQRGTILRDADDIDVVAIPNAQLPVSAVPIRGRVSASGFADLFDDPSPEMLTVPFEAKGCYAVQASGDCMEPYLRDGEYAIIDPNRAVLDKKVVLATLDGEYTLKRVRVRGDQVELVPDNPKHAPIPVRTNKVVIKGVVIWSCRKF